MANLSKDLNTTFKSEHQKALANIKYTSNWLSKIFDSKFKNFDITTQQYNILRILKGAKTAIKVSTVKSRMVEKSPNTTRLMDKLFDKTLINRFRKKDDRRSVYVEITKKGLNLINKINVNDARLNLEMLTKQEIEILNKLLNKIRG